VTISILKCAIIAGKYGSFSYEHMDQLCSRYITVDELNTEHMLSSWANQNPQQIFQNIENAMRKSSFDDSNFVVSFVKHPRAATLKAFRDAELEEAKHCEIAQKRLQRPLEEFKKGVEAFPYDPEEKIKLIGKSLHTIAFKKGEEDKPEYTNNQIHYFRGKIILYYLIKKYNESHMNKYMRAISLFVGFARGYLPMFGVESWNIFPGQDKWDKAILFLLNVSLIYFY